ncbi:MAG: succinate dehydrogenase, cytochrome b556 subunit [Endozoicomonadaceae bacterium]|nr:succinate dehydrogenase, cytochrome b556 subunit [Endozoicomonadaceae bacterium]
MNTKRPVNLDMLSIKLPLTAIASILHRISGFILVFIIGFFLYLLDCSLQSESTFTLLVKQLNQGWIQSMIWLFLSAFIYHFCAGIKHLLMDMGYGESKTSGRIAAGFCLLISVVISILLGVWMVC